jgi:GMP synthase-like glutamine amidotransferase
MKAHILQHVQFEDIGSIRSYLSALDAAVTYTRFHEHDALPNVDDLNLIIVMGGPMSANDESSLPWLRAEKVFIREAVQKEIPILGICLGAQLIANALGARVYPNVHKEIGWLPTVSTPCKEDCFRFPEKFLAFHWHGETFDLPPGAVLLARSEACENQAFQIGRRALGLQFHLETTPESLEAIINNCRRELTPGPHIQTEIAMQQIPKAAYADINAIMNALLSYIIA